MNVNMNISGRGCKTVITWILLILPCLLFLLMLNSNDGISKEEAEDGGVLSLGLVNEANSRGNHPHRTSPHCQCSCDNGYNYNSNNIINTPPSFSGGGPDETTLLPVAELNANGYMNVQEVGGISSGNGAYGLNDLDSVDRMPLNANLPVIYVITPTYYRATQVPDITRFAQTLMLVKNIFWIVAEDANERNDKVTELLEHSGIPYVHLLTPRPKTHRDWRSGRGVVNRRKGLEWIRENVRPNDGPGVIYLADDDNTYDIRVFEEMRYTKKVSVWPVGLLNELGLSSPIVQNGKLIGFHDPFMRRRKFAVDMAGFAVRLELFLSKPKATMPYKVGYEEDYFIKSLGVTMDDLEIRADNCTKIYVWHTKTKSNTFPSYANLKDKDYSETNLLTLYKNTMKTSQNQVGI